MKVVSVLCRILAFVLVPAVCCSCSVVPASSRQEPVGAGRVTAGNVSQDGRYCWQLLEKEQQALYSRIEEAARNMEPEITETDFDVDTLFRVAKYVCLDYPEYFWFEGPREASTTSKDGKIQKVVLTLGYTMNKSQQSAAVEEVEAAAQDCLSGIEADWSDYDKIKAVHDWIVSGVEYDAGTDDQSLYSVLVGKRGVCAGYTRTTQYLLNRLGIPCTYVSGTARGGSHSWNLLQADGEYYYLDTTWDDPSFAGTQEKKKDAVYYEYFCVTTDELFRDHTPGDALPLPECTATACNYFVHSGLLLDTYQYDAVLEILRQAAAEKRDATFRFASAQALKEAEEDLIEKRKIFDMLDEVAQEYDLAQTDRASYTIEEEKYIFNIYLKFA